MTSANGEHDIIPPQSDPDLAPSIELTPEVNNNNNSKSSGEANNNAPTTGLTVPSSEAQAQLQSQPDDPPPTTTTTTTTTTKARRVRTGCLTCRERHLKCDEAIPYCRNCQRSGRPCRRGIRLNFIDTQTVTPPYHIVHPPGTRVTFRDESRRIASFYIGGFERYPPLETEESLEGNRSRERGREGEILSSEILSPGMLQDSTQSMVSPFLGILESEMIDIIFDHDSCSALHVPFPDQIVSQGLYSGLKQAGMNPGYGELSYLNNPEDVLLMQTFVEEVGPWMDAMDAKNHFTRILPSHALEEPMLLKALMACGARHLYLVNPSYGEDKALYYYDTASQDLLGCLQDPDRDSVLCATTAVILHAYELMSPGSIMHHMNHTAGARALIKECGWDARSPGLGGACFWLSVDIELLTCLQFNWILAWDPDSWDVNMDTMDQAHHHHHYHSSLAGDEEDIWTHRIVYICAKISNFRASILQLFHAGAGAGAVRDDVEISQRCQEWATYSTWCDQWSKSVPRSMRPLAYLQPWQTNSKSVFPKVWLPTRSAIVSRLFYHTARILLFRAHPLNSEFSPELRSMQQIHAHDICGIVANVKDRRVTNIAINCLAIAAECLLTREAQGEVLQVLDKMPNKPIPSAIQIKSIKSHLQELWGWNNTTTTNNTNDNDNNDIIVPQHQNLNLVSGDNIPGSLFITEDTTTTTTAQVLSGSRIHIPSGIVNPVLAAADFSLEGRPYRDYYVAPRGHVHAHAHGPVGEQFNFGNY